MYLSLRLQSTEYGLEEMNGNEPLVCVSLDIERKE